jgi:hypothetical protein
MMMMIIIIIIIELQLSDHSPDQRDQGMNAPWILQVAAGARSI